MPLPHLRDLPIPSLAPWLSEAGLASPDAKARRLALDVHRRGALDWDDLSFGKRVTPQLQAVARFGPLLTLNAVRLGSDGTRKYVFQIAGGHVVEAVLIHNRENRTLCLSSQAGCAMGCTFCATGRLGLARNLTPGEISEVLHHVERERREAPDADGVRVTDLVFMGMGEPLHNYDAVLDAVTNLNHDLGHGIGRKRLTVSTVGLVPQIRRWAAERRPWRLHLSLHSAVQETREQLVPLARRHALPELIDAMRTVQQECGLKWLTCQYVLIPDVNMDDEHVAAIGRELAGLRYILNVIPWNDTGAAYRAPTWDEVKRFTTKLRTLGCPVKIRYSAGKQDGMGCGQLAAETLAAPGERSSLAGHMASPPGIFTG